MRTVNELLGIMDALRRRVSELKELRKEVAVKDTYYGNTERSRDPQYSVRLVDKKVVELQNFLLKADSAIKQSNAATTVNIEVDVEALLSPLE